MPCAADCLADCKMLCCKNSVISPERRNKQTVSASCRDEPFAIISVTSSRSKSNGDIEDRCDVGSIAGNV